MPNRSHTARTARRFASETGWPPPLLLVIVTKTAGTFSGAALGQEGLERRDVHVSLERMEHRWNATLGDDQVDGLGAGVLDVGAGRIEMGVVGDGLSGATDRREQDLLGGPALVRRDDVFEREERLDRLEERIP